MIDSYTKEVDLKNFDEICASYFQYGLYFKLANIIETAISTSRRRQCMNTLPTPKPPKQVLLFFINKAVRLVPTSETGDKKDHVDLTLVGNMATKQKKLEDWAKVKEKETCRVFLDKVNKEKSQDKRKHKKVKYKSISRVRDLKR